MFSNLHSTNLLVFKSPYTMLLLIIIIGRRWRKEHLRWNENTEWDFWSGADAHHCNREQRFIAWPVSLTSVLKWQLFTLYSHPGPFLVINTICALTLRTTMILMSLFRSRRQAVDMRKVMTEVMCDELLLDDTEFKLWLVLKRHFLTINNPDRSFIRRAFD